MTLSQYGEPFSFSLGEKTTQVVFSSIAELCSLKVSRTRLTVTDGNVRGLFSSFDMESGVFTKAPGEDVRESFAVLPPGERHKTFGSLETILSAALAAGLTRDSDFIAMGGGVVCDLCALASSLYMRGAGLILIPTTLLAMVDASLGGKTGLDFQGCKNLVGSFFPAREIRICPEFLLTLPPEEFKNGLAELIKHALLEKTGLLDDLVKNREAILARDPRLMAELIAKSLQIKGRYIQEDFREENIRAFLNLGHTFGHALESLTGFSGWSHGEAVAWGIARAMDAGLSLGITRREYAQKVRALLESFGFSLEIPRDLNAEKLLALMERDKKKRNGAVGFILQTDWGETLQREIPRDILMGILKS